MEREKISSVHSFVQGKVGQILVDFFAKYCDDGIAKLSSKDQVSATQEMVIQLSILLSAFVVSNERMFVQSLI